MNWRTKWELYKEDLKWAGMILLCVAVGYAIVIGASYVMWVIER